MLSKDSGLPDTRLIKASISQVIRVESKVLEVVSKRPANSLEYRPHFFGKSIHMNRDLILFLRKCWISSLYNTQVDRNYCLGATTVNRDDLSLSLVWLETS